MFTYAKLDKNNKLENIILADENFINEQIDKENYVRLITNEDEEKEAKKNFKFALNRPQEGNIYNFEKRKFKNNPRYPSWIFNEETYEWEPPVPKPISIIHEWDEENKLWKETKF
jgi:hypothetical protein